MAKITVKMLKENKMSDEEFNEVGKTFFEEINNMIEKGKDPRSINIEPLKKGSKTYKELTEIFMGLYRTMFTPGAWKYMIQEKFKDGVVKAFNEKA